MMRGLGFPVAVQISEKPLPSLMLLSSGCFQITGRVPVSRIYNRTLIGGCGTLQDSELAALTLNASMQLNIILQSFSLIGGFAASCCYVMDFRFGLPLHVFVFDWPEKLSEIGFSNENAFQKIPKSLS